MRIQLGQKQGRKEEASHRSLVEQVGNWLLAGEIKRERETRRESLRSSYHLMDSNSLRLFTLPFYFYKAFSSIFLPFVFFFFHVLSFLFVMTWLHCSFSLHKWTQYKKIEKCFLLCGHQSFCIQSPKTSSCLPFCLFPVFYTSYFYICLISFSLDNFNDQ